MIPGAKSMTLVQVVLTHKVYKSYKTDIRWICTLCYCTMVSYTEQKKDKTNIKELCKKVTGQAPAELLLKKEMEEKR